MGVGSVELCHKNGWTVGTCLAGDEGYGETIIQITAVTRQNVLAETIMHNGKPADMRESTWSLWYREWVMVSP